jgi:hypothetical protein
MNIETHNPELEQRVREQIQRGQFHNMDDLLEKALDALQEKETAAAPVTHYERPAGRKSLVELFAASPLPASDPIRAWHGGSKPLIPPRRPATVAR